MNIIITTVIGLILTSLFGLVAYFLNRIITKNDEFQEQTGRSLSVLRRKVERNETTLVDIKHEIREAGFDKETKTKISKIALNLQGMNIDLAKIKPIMVKAEENHGTVMWLKDRFEAQDKKLVGLYQIMKKLTEK